MFSRPLGTTGLQVTPLGLGLAALGRPAYMTLGRDRDLGDDRSVATMQRRCHEMLDHAYAIGVRYVDAARSYGLAESFLASWLQRRQPADVTVGSKWGYAYRGEWRLDPEVHEVKDLSLETFMRQRAESTAILGRHLRLYQIHSATLESGVLDDAAVLEALADARAGGLTIGLTVTGPRQADIVRKALSVKVAGGNPFQVVQATWNLLEPSAGPALAEAHASGWGVIVKEVLANGRLTEAYADGHPRPWLQQAATSAGVPLDVLAVAAALRQPWVDVVLSGAVTPSQLQRNITAQTVEVEADELRELAVPADQYWVSRGQMSWS